MKYKRIISNALIALDSVQANRIRSLLTALGIIFGVSAVISMLAIGNGAQKEIMAQMELVGVNNIVINPIIEQSEEVLSDENLNTDEEESRFSPGLTLKDHDALTSIAGISQISPEIVINTDIVKNGVRRSGKLVGVTTTYFNLFNFELSQGKLFNSYQLETGSPVCVIGKSVSTKFFPTENPLGKYIKCGENWLKIIGVLDERIISNKTIKTLGIRDYNMDIYSPIKTLLIKYVNRSLITKSKVLKKAKSNENYHQLDKLVIQVEESKLLTPVSEIITKRLSRSHQHVIDFEVTIPELLLKQQKRTQTIFNYVLGAIASISLLVGGIGIMNIMLASVLERIKEIGLRISLGAKKSDIVGQFMFEAILISIVGGFLGIVLGIALSYAVSIWVEIPTVISFSSILISFGVASAVGLFFGIIPARKAAKQNPIESLRYE